MLLLVYKSFGKLLSGCKGMKMMDCKRVPIPDYKIIGATNFLESIFTFSNKLFVDISYIITPIFYKLSSLLSFDILPILLHIRNPYPYNMLQNNIINKYLLHKDRYTYNLLIG